MKKRGLKNRFNQDTRSNWLFWYSCMLCGKNNWNVLHHIISPSMKEYVRGKHNTSVLNSCPIHNFKCHIDNPNLYKKETIAFLLNRTKDALIKKLGYELKENDREFIKIYKELYEK